MAFKNIKISISQLLGFGVNSTSHGEKIISAVGGMIAIFMVCVVSQQAVNFNFLSIQSGYVVIASMGASAVLLFSIPHGALSQPWSVFCGHLISALVGVAVVKLFGTGFTAAGLSVGLAILAMAYLRCIHPPGGATALTAVLGGATINELGFYFLFVPIILNLIIILSVALIFNNIFHWRRYPAHLARMLKPTTASVALERQFELTQEDFAAAIVQLDSFVDITTDGLIDLLELAKIHAEKNIMHPDEIIAGKIYSNGKLGNLWSVRQVVDAGFHQNPEKDRVIYKVLAGAGGYETGICTRSEFKIWARFEVVQDNKQWLKVEG